jgi:hypothetical protein
MIFNYIQKKEYIYMQITFITLKVVKCSLGKES